MALEELRSKTYSRKDFIKLIGCGALAITIAPFVKNVSQIVPNSNSNSNSANLNGNGNGIVYPIGSAPLGTSMQEWVTRWAQWVSVYKDKESPLLTQNGNVVREAQPKGQRNMFFLTTGEMDDDQKYHLNVKRTIVIRKEASILLPVSFGIWGYADSKLIGIDFKNDEHVKDVVHRELNTASSIVAKLNGKDIPAYRIDSGELFNTYYADSKHFKTTAQFTRSFMDGWFVFLKPLPPASYTIYSASRLEKALDTGRPFHDEVTHTIHVI